MRLLRHKVNVTNNYEPPIFFIFACHHQNSSWMSLELNVNLKQEEITLVVPWILFIRLVEFMLTVHYSLFCLQLPGKVAETVAGITPDCGEECGGGCLNVSVMN